MPKKQPDKPAAKEEDELEDRLKPTGPESPHAFVQRRMRELHIQPSRKEDDLAEKNEESKP